MKKIFHRFSIRLAMIIVAAFALQQSVSMADTVVVGFGANFAFTPKIININIGDTIIFSNNSAGFEHTVTGTGAEPMCGASIFTTLGSGCSHTFTTAGSFPFQCNFHAVSFNMTGLVNVASVVVPPPTISISSPTNGAVFAEPASIALAAIVGGGTVTNVTFFAGTNQIGTVTNAPFTLRSTPLAAGTYALTAVASAGGVSATSAVVNVTAVTPLPISASTPLITNGQFSFLYSANPGLNYVIQNSSNLTTWLSLATNTAATNPVLFTDTLNTNTNAASFYRVGLSPNP
ncbi:MAG TPA: Ig-like domain-containing protein [Verrucomicrobiae bacterium]|nr:Ig-like domain-containing protein [Verrucomicrobiae bacterium]